MTLVMAMSGIIHTVACYARGKRTYKVVASDMPLADIAEFLRVRRLPACHACLRDYVEQDE